MRKIILILLIGFFLTGCKSTTEEISYEELSHEVIQHLINKEYQAVHTYFSEDLQQSLPIEQVETDWLTQTKDAGEFISLLDAEYTNQTSSHSTIETPLEFANVIFKVRLIFNDENKIVSLYYTQGYANAQLPSNVIEEEVTVGEETDFPLGGTLTLPENYEGPLPAVVLVHGSGPSDRDETAFAYKVFRDIAWGLAEQGIASLRYDKRTFVHGNKMVAQLGDAITIKEETIDDAILATQLLKSDPRIDENNVYIIGHSLGGMLAPRIDYEGGDFAGLVVLAGSVRTLWEIIYDQNMAMIQAENMEEEIRLQNEKLVEAEMEKAQKILDMTTEEAKSETIFGIPAYYFQYMDMFQTKDVVANLEKPIFVLQGSEDFQVYLDKDFVLWEELLSSKEKATLKTYPGLNHFFITSEGENKGTIKEYEIPNKVDIEVINDIAAWINQHARNE